VPSIENLDLRVVDPYFLVDLERLKICDSVITEGVVDVSCFLCGLFESFVPEPACVIAVSVRY
jgi:hypothetical protein